jgi:hypothetical protein
MAFTTGYGTQNALKYITLAPVKIRIFTEFLDLLLEPCNGC